jgi:LacI family transcriptional regulator
VTDAAGDDLITYNTDGEIERERKFRCSALEGRVDGVVITPFHVPLRECAILAAAGVAVVALTTEPPPEDAAPLNTLAIDCVAAARTAVDYLIAQGHTRIGMVAGEAGTPPREDRVRGYTQALQEHGLLFDRMLVRGADFKEQGGDHATQGLLRLAERPTAFFAANNLMAMGAMSALREAGLRVPRDIAVIGFDDIPGTRLVDPALTTIAQYPERLGARAAQLLLDRLGVGGPATGRHIEMPFGLVVRQSA